MKQDPRRRSAVTIGLVSFLIIGLGLFLAGCDLTWMTDRLPFSQTQAAPTQTGDQLPTLATSASPRAPSPGLTATQVYVTPSPLRLKIWLPPQFDPNGQGQANALLKARLDAFSALYPGLQLDIRVKAPTGPGGLLETLTATSAAAPGALPDLIALSRSDLEAATLKGLVYPLDGKINVSDDPDWFAYSRQMALLQGTTFGMPFAGDAMILVYRPVLVGKPPSDWNGLLQLKLNNVVAFPADDAQGLLTLALYQSTGAPIQDAQQRPVLNVDALSTVLKVYDSGAKAGVFPYWLSQYGTDGQSWQAFQDKRATWAVTWVTRYLSEMPADASILSLYSMSKTSFTLADGWVWAIANPHPDQRKLAVGLAEFLVDGNFLAKWTSAAGYLPTRPSALAGWSNQSLQSMLSQVVISAQLRPSDDIMVTLGPVLQDATMQVLKGQSDPTQAAQTAADHLKGP